MRTAEFIRRPSNMALAFIDAAAHHKATRQGRESVSKACLSNSGIVSERAINLALSFKTVQKLKKEGAIL